MDVKCDHCGDHLHDSNCPKNNAVDSDTRSFIRPKKSKKTEGLSERQIADSLAYGYHNVLIAKGEIPASSPFVAKNYSKEVLCQEIKTKTLELSLALTEASRAIRSSDVDAYQKSLTNIKKIITEIDRLIGG